LNKDTNSSNVLTRMSGIPDPQSAEKLRAEKEYELMLKLAEKIHKFGLATPAILFLEMSRPLSFVANQFLIFMGPIVNTFFTIKEYKIFVDMLEKRENIGKLIDVIENYEEIKTQKKGGKNE